jgi:hypothetical protein
MTFGVHDFVAVGQLSGSESDGEEPESPEIRIESLVKPSRRHSRISIMLEPVPEDENS